MKKKIEFIKFRYEEKAIEWENEHDDRKLFSNLYYMIINALESIIDCENVYVKVAINNAISEDIKRMDNILNRFI